MLSVSFSYCHAECRHAECRHAECRYAECRGVNIVHGLVCNAVKVDVAVAVRERERGGAEEMGKDRERGNRRSERPRKGAKQVLASPARIATNDFPKRLKG